MKLSRTQNNGGVGLFDLFTFRPLGSVIALRVRIDMQVPAREPLDDGVTAS